MVYLLFEKCPVVLIVDLIPALSDKWILLDNNGAFVALYNCLNPFISMGADDFLYYQNGLFVIGKGFDIWDYSAGYEDFTGEKMYELAYNIACFEDMFNTENYEWSY